MKEALLKNRDCFVIGLCLGSNTGEATHKRTNLTPLVLSISLMAEKKSTLKVDT
jgi:hypothetical protein